MTTGTIRHATFARNAMTFIDTVSDTFYRPTEEPGVAYVSIRDERHNTVLDVAEDWPRRDAVAEAASLQGIARLSVRIPLLDAVPLGAWVGLDGVTENRRAIYGQTPVNGLVLGGNYKGFKVAPAVGHCLAELVTTGHCASVDLSPFDLSRFTATTRPLRPPQFSLSNVS